MVGGLSRKQTTNPMAIQPLDTMSDEELTREWPKDDRFFQFYNERVWDFIKLNQVNRNAANIFMFFASRMSPNTNAVACSYEFLVSMFKISKSTAYAAIKTLIEENFIKKYNSGNMGVYVLYGDVVWKRDEMNRQIQIGQISTEIFISKEEQICEE